MEQNQSILTYCFEVTHVGGFQISRPAKRHGKYIDVGPILYFKVSNQREPMTQIQHICLVISEIDIHIPALWYTRHPPHRRQAQMNMMKWGHSIKYGRVHDSYIIVHTPYFLSQLIRLMCRSTCFLFPGCGCGVVYFAFPLFFPQSTRGLTAHF